MLLFLGSFFLVLFFTCLWTTLVICVVKRGYLLYCIYIMFGSNKEHSSSSSSICICLRSTARTRCRRCVVTSRKNTQSMRQKHRRWRWGSHAGVVVLWDVVLQCIYSMWCKDELHVQLLPLPFLVPQTSDNLVMSVHGWHVVGGCSLQLCCGGSI